MHSRCHNPCCSPKCECLHQPKPKWVLCGQLVELSTPWATPVASRNRASYSLAIVRGTQCNGESLAVETIDECRPDFLLGLTLTGILPALALAGVTPVCIFLSPLIGAVAAGVAVEFQMVSAAQ